MTIKTELLALKKRNGLIVVAEAHEWAKNNPTSDLHRALEWDDETAGYQYRCWQIRHLIIFNVRDENNQRELVSLSMDQTNPGGGYRPMIDILETPHMREMLLQDALEELKRIEEKYKRLIELARVFEEADKVRKRTKRRRPPTNKRRRRRPPSDDIRPSL